MSVDPQDEDLLAYLELPEEHRAGVADAFFKKLERQLLVLHPRLSRAAERALNERVGHGASGEGEDVAMEVIMAALSAIKTQFLGEEAAKLEWTRPMSLFQYLMVIHGRPFAGTNGGIITNYIRRRRRDRATTALDEENALADDSANAEQRLIASDEEKRRRKIIEEGLAKLGTMRPRDVFIFRLRTGLHRFDKLDAAAIMELARDLRLSRTERAMIQTVEASLCLKSECLLGPGVVGKLVGLSERRISGIVAKVTDWLVQWLGLQGVIRHTP